jgi:hypothetical protein
MKTENVLAEGVPTPFIVSTGLTMGLLYSGMPTVQGYGIIGM